MPPALRPLVPYGPQLAAEAAGELAERQDWAIGRLQLLALGIGSERIKSWLRSRVCFSPAKARRSTGSAPCGGRGCWNGGRI